jgi:hypothetical protein
VLCFWLFVLCLILLSCVLSLGSFLSRVVFYLSLDSLACGLSLGFFYCSLVQDKTQM